MQWSQSFFFLLFFWNWKLDQVGQNGHYYLVKNCDQIHKGLSSGLLSSWQSVTSVFFVIFFFYLAVPAGQTIECRFLVLERRSRFFETGSSICPLCWQSVRATQCSQDVACKCFQTCGKTTFPLTDAAYPRRRHTLTALAFILENLGFHHSLQHVTQHVNPVNTLQFF